MNMLATHIPTAATPSAAPAPAAVLRPMMLPPDDSDFREKEAQRIVEAFRAQGMQIRWTDALRAWTRYSDSMFCEWMAVPKEPATIVDLIEHHFVDVPSRIRAVA